MGDKTPWLGKMLAFGAKALAKADASADLLNLGLSNNTFWLLPLLAGFIPFAASVGGLCGGPPWADLADAEEPSELIDIAADDSRDHSDCACVPLIRARTSAVSGERSGISGSGRRDRDIAGDLVLLKADVLMPAFDMMIKFLSF